MGNREIMDQEILEKILSKRITELEELRIEASQAGDLRIAEIFALAIKHKKELQEQEQGGGDETK